ncbi:hypothetical protein FACS1894164_17880 [Spirochaetia bacterium]|nr:hypothetical protein FACS1894164_17880 [Spirochaetia bacterium]
MRNISIILLIIVVESIYAEIPVFWDVLWNASGEYEKKLSDRIHAKIGWQDFSARFQLLDRRPITFDGAGETGFSTGMYHNQTGSRLLFGAIDEFGLAARLRSPLNRSITFFESHAISRGDLKTGATAAGTAPSLYLYAGTPLFATPAGGLRAFASAHFDPEWNGSFGAGASLAIDTKKEIRIEALYTGKDLPARPASAWFSNPPPLPKRNFDLFALSAAWTSPLLKIAADFASSNTAAYGIDLYTNIGIRYGNRPWQFSLAADGMGSRYVGRDGVATGAGFRIGAKAEYFGGRSTRFRVNTLFRARAAGEPFNRSSTTIYYHFPTNISFPVKPTRVSLSAGRNASDLKKIEDKFDFSAGFVWQALSVSLSSSLVNTASHDSTPVFIPIPDISTDFKSLKAGMDFSYRLKIFQFRAGFDYTGYDSKDPVWGISTGISATGTWWRVNLKIASSDLPEKWTGTFSFTLHKKGKQIGW